MSRIALEEENATDEDPTKRCPTIQAFSAEHPYLSIHVGTGSAALGIFTGYYAKA